MCLNIKCHYVSMILTLNAIQYHLSIRISTFRYCFGYVLAVFLLRKATRATSVTESVTKDDRNPCITHIYAYLSYMCHNKTS